MSLVIIPDSRNYFAVPLTTERFDVRRVLRAVVDLKNSLGEVLPYLRWRWDVYVGRPVWGTILFFSPVLGNLVLSLGFKTFCKTVLSGVVLLESLQACWYLSERVYSYVYAHFLAYDAALEELQLNPKHLASRLVTLDFPGAPNWEEIESELNTLIARSRLPIGDVNYFPIEPYDDPENPKKPLQAAEIVENFLQAKGLIQEETPYIGMPADDAKRVRNYAAIRKKISFILYAYLQGKKKVCSGQERLDRDTRLLRFFQDVALSMRNHCGDRLSAAVDRHFRCWLAAEGGFSSLEETVQDRIWDTLASEREKIYYKILDERHPGWKKLLAGRTHQSDQVMRFLEPADGLSIPGSEGNVQGFDGEGVRRLSKSATEQIRIAFWNKYGVNTLPTLLNQVLSDLDRNERDKEEGKESLADVCNRFLRENCQSWRRDEFAELARQRARQCQDFWSSPPLERPEPRGLKVLMVLCQQVNVAAVKKAWDASEQQPCASSVRGGSPQPLTAERYVEGCANPALLQQWGCSDEVVCAAQQLDGLWKQDLWLDPLSGEASPEEKLQASAKKRALQGALAFLDRLNVLAYMAEVVEGRCSQELALAAINKTLDQYAKMEQINELMRSKDNEDYTLPQFASIEECQSAAQNNFVSQLKILAERRRQELFSAKCHDETTGELTRNAALWWLMELNVLSPKKRGRDPIPDA